jgi:hypothetical protein
LKLSLNKKEMEPNFLATFERPRTQEQLLEYTWRGIIAIGLGVRCLATIVLMVFTFGGTLFFTSYQQPWIPQAESIMQDAGWNPKHLWQAAWIYAGVVILTLMVFLPYWKAIGVIPL